MVNKILNQLYKKLSRPTEPGLQAFEQCGRKTKHQVIRQMFYNNKPENVSLAIRLINRCCDLKIKDGEGDIAGMYINLLCIILAKTHDRKHLPHIIRAKQHYFFYIDSTLLFEFSPSGKREDCVRETLKYVQTAPVSTGWFRTFKEWICHYYEHYDEKLVSQYWSLYKTSSFKKRLDDRVKFM